MQFSGSLFQTNQPGDLVSTMLILSKSVDSTWGLDALQIVLLFYIIDEKWMKYGPSLSHYPAPTKQGLMNSLSTSGDTFYPHLTDISVYFRRQRLLLLSHIHVCAPNGDDRDNRKRKNTQSVSKMLGSRGVVYI